MAEFSDLVGKTITKIVGAEEDSKEILFFCDDGCIYRMFHEQDCCEEVRVEDICGDPGRLIGRKVVKSEAVTQKGNSYDVDSYTWTFYHICTGGGFLSIRWFGNSNGYYSEEVNFEKFKDVEILTCATCAHEKVCKYVTYNVGQNISGCDNYKKEN